MAPVAAMAPSAPAARKVSISAGVVIPPTPRIDHSMPSRVRTATRRRTCFSARSRIASPHTPEVGRPGPRAGWPVRSWTAIGMVLIAATPWMNGPQAAITASSRAGSAR